MQMKHANQGRFVAVDGRHIITDEVINGKQPRMQQTVCM